MPPKSKVVPVHGELKAIPNLTQAQADLAEAIDAGYQERITRQSETITRFVEFMESRPGLMTQFSRWMDGHVDD